MSNELQSIQRAQHSPTSCALHKHVMCISMFHTEPDHTAEPVGVIKVTSFFVCDLHHLITPRVQRPILPSAIQTSWNYSLAWLVYTITTPRPGSIHVIGVGDKTKWTVNHESITDGELQIGSQRTYSRVCRSMTLKYMSSLTLGTQSALRVGISNVNYANRHRCEKTIRWKQSKRGATALADGAWNWCNYKSLTEWQQIILIF